MKCCKCVVVTWGMSDANCWPTCGKTRQYFTHIYIDASSCIHALRSTYTWLSSKRNQKFIQHAMMQQLSSQFAFLHMYLSINACLLAKFSKCPKLRKFWNNQLQYNSHSLLHCLGTNHINSRQNSSQWIFFSVCFRDASLKWLYLLEAGVTFI